MPRAVWTKLSLLTLACAVTLTTGCAPSVVVVEPGAVIQLGPDGGTAPSVIVQTENGHELRRGPVRLPPGWYLVAPPSEEPK